MDALQQCISSLNKKEREEFEKAQHRGYLVDPSKTRDNLYGAYMTWCHVTSTPAISIRRRHVEFWFLSGPADLSDQGLDEMLALWRKYSYLPDDGESGNYICNNSGYFVGILPEDLEPLARDLFLALRKHDSLDTSMSGISPPLPFDHSISAWVKDRAIPYAWPQLSNA